MDEFLHMEFEKIDNFFLKPFSLNRPSQLPQKFGPDRFSRYDFYWILAKGPGVAREKKMFEFFFV